MQPTNRLHLGNYLGALKNWVNLQHDGYQCLYCVVDMHAITMPYDPSTLATATREIAAAWPRQLGVDCCGRWSETVVEKITSRDRKSHKKRRK